MPSSFGQWYQDQKNVSNPNDIEGGEAGGDGGSGSGGGGGVMMMPLFGNASVASASASATAGMESVSSSLTGLKSSFEAQFPSKVCGMNYQERFRMFCALLCLSALFFLLAFSVGLPTITIRPQKFAISFTFGSLMFMGSFAILKGPEAHLRGMFERERMVFSTIYFASMFSTLYFTLHVGGVEGYVTVLASSGVQLVALLWYLISFIPGGSAGLHVLLSAMAKMLRPLLVGCAKVWSAIVTRCFGWIVR